MQAHASRRITVDGTAVIDVRQIDFVAHLRIEQLRLQAEGTREIVAHIAAEVRARQVSVVQLWGRREGRNVRGGFDGHKGDVADAGDVQAGLSANRQLGVGVRQREAYTEQKGKYFLLHIMIVVGIHTRSNGC